LNQEVEPGLLIRLVTDKVSQIYSSK